MGTLSISKEQKKIFDNAIKILDLSYVTKWSGSMGIPGYIKTNTPSDVLLDSFFPESSSKNRIAILGYTAKDVDELTDVVGTFRERINHWGNVFKIDPAVLYGIFETEVTITGYGDMLDKNSSDKKQFVKMLVKLANYKESRKSKGDSVIHKPGVNANSAGCTGIGQLQVLYNNSVKGTSYTDALNTPKSRYKSSKDEYSLITSEVAAVKTRLEALVNALIDRIQNLKLGYTFSKTSIIKLTKLSADSTDAVVTSTITNYIDATYGAGAGDCTMFKDDNGISWCKVSINCCNVFRMHYTPFSNTARNESSRVYYMAVALALTIDLDAAICLTANLLRSKMNLYLSSAKLLSKLPGGSYTKDGSLLDKNQLYTPELLMSAIYGYLGWGEGGDGYGTTGTGYVKKVAGYLPRYYARLIPASASMEYPNNETISKLSIRQCKYVIGSDLNLKYDLNSFTDMTESNTPAILMKVEDRALADEIASYMKQMDNMKMYDLVGDVEFRPMADTELIKNIKSFYNSAMNVTPLNLAGIIGLPPRFPELADPRLNLDTANKYGLKVGDGIDDVYTDIYGPIYTKLYMGTGHIVTMTPGIPEFMVGFDADTQNALLAVAAKGAAGAEATGAEADAMAAKLEESTKDLVEQTRKARAGGTLFGFKPDWVRYTHMVRNLNYVTAKFFGITDYMWYNLLDDNEKSAVFGSDPPPKDDNTLTMKYFDPINLDKNKKMIFSMLESKGIESNNIKTNEGVDMYNIYMYNNGPMNMSEDVANSVGPSVLNQVLGMSPNEQMKDLNFLTNGLTAKHAESALKWAKKSSIIQGLLKDNGLLGRATTSIFGLGQTAAAISGAQIRLPDVFKGSDYNKSFEIRLKLTTPNPTRGNFFKDIMTEFNRIMPLALPQQFGSFVDAQLSPFLVQIYSKGLIACELAMVTSISITRNPETFSLNRFPSEIDLVITAKDLAPMLSIPDNANDITASMDRKYISSGIVPYLATYAGIPLYRSDNMDFFTRKFQKLSNIADSVKSTPEKAIVQGAQHQWSKLTNALTR